MTSDDLDKLHDARYTLTRDNTCYPSVELSRETLRWLIEKAEAQQRVEKVLDTKLPQFAAELAEYAPVKLGEYCPSQCVKVAASMVRMALEGHDK